MLGVNIKIIVKTGFPGLVFLAGMYYHNIGDDIGIPLMLLGIFIFLLLNNLLPLIAYENKD